MVESRLQHPNLHLLPPPSPLHWVVATASSRQGAERGEGAVKCSGLNMFEHDIRVSLHESDASQDSLFKLLFLDSLFTSVLTRVQRVLGHICVRHVSRHGCVASNCVLVLHKLCHSGGPFEIYNTTIFPFKTSASAWVKEAILAWAFNLSNVSGEVGALCLIKQVAVTDTETIPALSQPHHHVMTPGNQIQHIGDASKPSNSWPVPHANQIYFSDDFLLLPINHILLASILSKEGTSALLFSLKSP